MTYHDPFGTAASLRDVCPSVMTASELMTIEIPEVKWVIPQLLPAGLALLAGPPKVGKSYLQVKLGKDIINGGGRVFYYAGEDSYYLLRTRLKQLNQANNKADRCYKQNGDVPSEQKNINPFHGRRDFR